MDPVPAGPIFKYKLFEPSCLRRFTTFSSGLQFHKFKTVVKRMPTPLQPSVKPNSCNSSQELVHIGATLRMINGGAKEKKKRRTWQSAGSVSRKTYTYVFVRQSSRLSSAGKAKDKRAESSPASKFRHSELPELTIPCMNDRHEAFPTVVVQKCSPLTDARSNHVPDRFGNLKLGRRKEA